MNPRSILTVSALLAVAAVSLSPKTSWLPGMAVHAARLGVSGGVEATKAWVVQTQPQKEAFALANAGSDLAKLEVVASRFPESVTTRAALLRAQTQDYRLHLDWREPNSRAQPSAQNLERLTERGVQLVASAEVSEKLDPDNAFFPAMTAVGLAAQGKETEALIALHRAAEKPRFDDGSTALVQGKLDLLEAAQGRTPHIARMAVAAAETYPHYAPLRSLSRIALSEAVAAEKAGDVERGFEIRQDIQKLGLRVRIDSAPFIGVLVGNALIAISASEPGGANTTEWKKLQRAGESDEAAQLRRQEITGESWRAWCVAHGHPERADVWQNVWEFRTGTKDLFQRVEPRNPISVTVAMQEMSLFIASGLLFLLAAGSGLAAWLSRRTLASTRWQARFGDAPTLDIHPSRIAVPMLAGIGLGVAALLGASRFPGPDALVRLSVVGIALIALSGPIAQGTLMFVAARRKLGYPLLSARASARSGGLIAACLWILWAGVQFAIAAREDTLRAGLDEITHNETRTLLRLAEK
ncbi:MAG: hypothetical protein QM758_05645 [Armatimonas sp.]